MDLKRNKKNMDPQYFEQVGIAEFLVPVLIREPSALGWLRTLDIDPRDFDDSPPSVRVLIDLFVGGQPPAEVTALLLELNSISHPSAFEELLDELRNWNHEPPDSALNEYNLPLWARVHAPNVLAGIVSHALDTKPRRLVEFARVHPVLLSRGEVLQAIPRLRDELRSVFTLKGRSPLCEIVHYATPSELDLFIYHGTTRRLRTVVDDGVFESGDAQPTVRVVQRDRAMMVARVCLSTGRIRIGARTSPDLELLRGTFGRAIFGDPSAYDVPSRMPLRTLLEHSALVCPASVSSARLVEVTLVSTSDLRLKLSVKSSDVLQAVQSGQWEIPVAEPVSAKFLLRLASGGRERALEVTAPNSVRASRSLDDALIEEFLALNGLLTPIVELEATG